MADVTGQISGADGTKDVILNNAATEATLRSLLASAQADTALLKQLAAKAGVDQVTLNRLEAEAQTSAVAIRGTTVSTRQLTESQAELYRHSKLVDASFYGLIESTKLLASGNATLSGVLSNFATLPGPLGLAIRGLTAFAQFQEANMKSYQSMTSAGVNFGGSLVQMRVAAQGTYMTLDQFSAMVASNRETLAKMGDNVNDGAVAFTKMSNSLISSEAGSKLLALGYTTEEVNQGMLGYINSTGGRTKEELKNTKAITEATSEYLVELDKISQFTGASRKQMEEEQKKAAAQAAYQRKLASMSEADRAKMEAARMAAAASGVDGASDAFMSAALGMPPLTKEAQALAGKFPDAYQGINNMANVSQRAGSTMQDVDRASGQFAEGIRSGTDSMGQSADALSLMGDKTVNSALAYSNKLNANGVKTADDYANKMAAIGRNQAAQAESEARTLADADKQLKSFGIAIMQAVAPLLSFLTPILKVLGPAMLLLTGAVVALKGALVAWEVWQRLKNAREQTGGAGSAALSMLRGGGPATTAATTAATAGTGVLGSLRSGAAGLIGGTGSLIEGALTGLANGLKQFANPQVAIGTLVMGLLAVPVFLLGKAFQSFSNISWGSVLMGTVVIAGLAIGAAALAGIAPLIAVSSVALGLLGGAIWLLGNGLNAFPSMAIPGMSAAFTGFGEIVSTVFGAINGLLSSLLDGIKAVFGVIWDVISWPFKMIGNLVSGVFSAIGSIVSVFFDVVKGTFGLVWDIISWPFKTIAGIVSGAFSIVGSIFTGFKDFVGGIFGWIWDKITSVLDIVKGAASFIGGLFGFGDSGGGAKSSEGSINAGEFNRATSTLLEAANKLSSAADKMMTMPSLGAGGGASSGGGIFSALKGLIIPEAGKNPVESAMSGLFGKEPAQSTQALNTESLTRQLETLNSTMQELLSYNKETAENTKRTHEATKGLSGDLFA